MMQTTRGAHPNLLELRALLRRENAADLGVGGIELAAHLRLYPVHDRVDAGVMLVDDALHQILLLRREVQIAIEMVDDAPRRELRRPRRGEESMAVKEVKAVAGDTDERAADERCDQRQSRRRASLTRRG